MRLLTTFILIAFLAACSSRAPSAKSAASLTQGFFKSYSRKYKTSFIGQAGIERAQVNGVQQLSKNHALVDSLILLKNGQTARVLLTTEYIAPFGWNVASWELLGVQ